MAVGDRSPVHRGAVTPCLVSQAQGRVDSRARSYDGRLTSDGEHRQAARASSCRGILGPSGSPTMQPVSTAGTAGRLGLAFRLVRAAVGSAELELVALGTER